MDAAVSRVANADEPADARASTLRPRSLRRGGPPIRRWPATMPPALAPSRWTPPRAPPVALGRRPGGRQQGCRAAQPGQGPVLPRQLPRRPRQGDRGQDRRLRGRLPGRRDARPDRPVRARRCPGRLRSGPGQPSARERLGRGSWPAQRGRRLERRARRGDDAEGPGPAAQAAQGRQRQGRRPPTCRPRTPSRSRPSR